MDNDHKPSTEILNQIINELKNHIKKSNGIFTSVNDTLNYRSVTLENKLKILFVEDVNSMVSSASMHVKVGSVHNPENLPGLAHFLEHMLFMGSDMYPGGTYFQNQVSHNGGMTNAYTDSEHTQYYFTSSGDFLELLKVFSRFFVNPSFDIKYVEKEVSAVDSEHKKNISSDIWRVMNVCKRLLKKSAHTRFNTGTKETLLGTVNNDSIKLREALIAFYEKYYSSDKMILYISHNNIDDKFVDSVVTLFSQIKLRDSIKIDTTASVRELDDEYEVIKIKTAGEGDYLLVRIMLEQNGKFVNNLPVDSYDVLDYLLNHTGQGSLYKILSDLDLVYDCSVGIESQFKDNVFYELQLKLTRNGSEKYEFILYIIDAYMKHLSSIAEKTDVMFDGFLEETNRLSLLGFKTRDKFDGLSLCQTLSDIHNATDISLEYALIVTLIQGDLQILRDHFKKSTKSMTINRFKVVLTSPTFNADNLTETDPMYGTKFSHDYVKIVRQYLNKTDKLLQDLIGKSGYHYPEKNKYIRDMETLRIVHTITDNDDTFYPINSENNNLYYAKKGNTFNTYSVYASFVVKLESMMCNNSNTNCTLSPKDYLVMLLYLLYINRARESEIQILRRAKFIITIGLGTTALTINVIGYNSDIGVDNIFEDVLEWFFDVKNVFNLDHKIYRLVYDNLMTSLQNYKYSDAYSLIMPEFRKMLNTKHHISNEQMIDTLKTLSLDKLLLSISDVTTKNLREYALNKMNKGTIIGVMGGSWTMKQINKMIRIMDTIFKPSIKTEGYDFTTYDFTDSELSKTSVKTHENPHNTERAIGYGLFVGKTKESDKTIDKNNKIGKNSIIDWRLMKPFCSILEAFMNEKFSSVIRTENEMGYVAMCNMYNINEANNPYVYLLFVAQSSRNDLEKIVKKYIDNNMMDDVRSMTKENFEALKTSTINLLSQKPLNIFDDCNEKMSALVRTYKFDEIDDMTKRFDRIDQMIEVLKAVDDHNIFIKFVENFFSKNIRSVIKIEPSVQVQSQ